MSSMSINDILEAMPKLNIRDRVHYDPYTGVFISRITGRQTGYKTRDGYIHVRIDRRTYLAHKLAWYMTYGRWPTMGLDHINRDKTDNRLSNLREATNSENILNSNRKRKPPVGGIHDLIDRGPSS